MGKRGPKPVVSRQELYFFAKEFYRDFQRLGRGYSHFRFDKKLYERLKQQLYKNRQFMDKDTSMLQRQVEQIRAARLGVAEKEKRIRSLQERRFWEMSEGGLINALEASEKKIRVGGKPEILESLLCATSPEEIRQICRDAWVLESIAVVDPATRRTISYIRSRVSSWPVSSGSTLPMYLSEHAEHFIAAKKNKRYPISNRPSSHLKRLWFLSRSLAGAVCQIRTRTAINLVTSKRPSRIRSWALQTPMPKVQDNAKE
jgi:hypothetical protein